MISRIATVYFYPLYSCVAFCCIDTVPKLRLFEIPM